jgi:hypothetical protein
VLFNIFISFFGTLANGFVIMAYYRDPRLHTIQNTIFLLLAITDISVTAFVQPTYVAALLSGLLGKPNCLLWFITMTATRLFILFSLLTIVILSLQSYITLAFPFRFQSILTNRRLKVMAAFFWLIVTTIALAFVFYPLLDVYFGVCIISSTIVIVVFTWIWTYKLVNRQQKAIHTNQPSSAQEVVSRKKILRSTVTAFAIILSLLGCYCFGLYYLIFSTYTWSMCGEAIVKRVSLCCR